MTWLRQDPNQKIKAPFLRWVFRIFLVFLSITINTLLLAVFPNTALTLIFVFFAVLYSSVCVAYFLHSIYYVATIRGRLFLIFLSLVEVQYSLLVLLEMYLRFI